ncbi:hypothetical protein BaRGS_00014716 [Batillaria attramentaria]|uniref:Uncharacterized protein n=1 Tax=Batillaria attramentaria TaxID=370345 RepID=A0ABD0L4B5_9CAEN
MSTDPIFKCCLQQQFEIWRRSETARHNVKSVGWIAVYHLSSVTITQRHFFPKRTVPETLPALFQVSKARRFGPCVAQQINFPQPHKNAQLIMDEQIVLGKHASLVQKG